MEKYIPFQLNLTPISFFEIVQEELNSNNYKNINENDFSYLKQENLYFKFCEVLDLSEKVYDAGIFNLIELNFFSVRKIKNMLKEADSFFEREGESIKQKEIVISYFFIKHLLKENYNEMRFNAFSSIEEIKFEVSPVDFLNGREYKKYIETLNDGNETIYKNLLINKNKILIITLLNYRLDSNINKKNLYNNHLVDKILSHMFYKGNNSITDYEYAFEKFQELVLSEKEFDNKKTGLSIYIETMRDLDVSLGNKTIHNLGENIFLGIFEATNYLEMDEDIQELIQFYFEYRKDSEENYLLESDISNLKELTINTKKDLKKLMECFIDLPILHNFTREKNIISFSKKYINLIRNIFRIKSVEDTFDIYLYTITEYSPNPHLNLSGEEEAYDEYNYYFEEYQQTFRAVLDNLKEIEKKISEKEISKIHDLQLEYLKEDLELIKDFISKIIELFTSNENPKYNKASSLFGPSLSDINEDKILEILDRNLTLEELNEYYKEERIDIFEIIEVIDRLPRN